MKFLKFSLLLFIATIAFSCVAPSENGAPQMIKTEVPERPAGQTDMLQFAAEPIPTVRVGFVGLGMRGPGAVQRFTHIPGVEIVALCDLRPERVDAAQEILRKAGFPEAAGYSGDVNSWKELVERLLRSVCHNRFRNKRYRVGNQISPARGQLPVKSHGQLLTLQLRGSQR
jgi:hypothetical protein